jgi:hypothetical protein
VLLYGVAFPDVLRGGGLPWLQIVKGGVITVLLEIDCSDLHPVVFHVREFLGTFTGCTGAYTNFKTEE